MFNTEVLRSKLEHWTSSFFCLEIKVYERSTYASTFRNIDCHMYFLINVIYNLFSLLTTVEKVR